MEAAQTSTTSEFDPAKWPVLNVSRDNLLSQDELREFMRIKHWRVALDVALFWVAVIGILQGAIYFQTWWAIGLAFVAMGLMQNALITWTHEASHCNLHRNKKWNDFLSDFFLCGPGGISVNQYRWHHVNHHKYLGDPEKEVEVVAWLCMRGGNLFAEIGKHICGYFAWMIIQRKKRFSQPDSPFRPPPPRSPAAQAGFLLGNAGLFALCALQGVWYFYFLLWVLPLFTIALLVSNFRTIVEHQASSDVCDLGMIKTPGFTRVVECGWLERAIIAPVGFYYHYEHHLFPSIPYHRLREVRKVLKERGLFEQEGVHKERGYFRTLWKLAMEPGYGVRMLNPFAELPHSHHSH